MRFGTKRRTTKLTIFVVYLFVLLLLVEGGLQVVHRIQKGTWIWQDAVFRVNYVQPIPDRRQYSLIPNYNVQDITISANGFRLPPPRDTGPLIVCAGDSIPFGFDLPDDQSYPAYLAQDGLNVLNAGVPSYNLRQSFDRLRLDVLPQYPNTSVVTIETANDPQLVYAFNRAWTPDVTWANVRMGIGRTPLATLFYLNNVAIQVRGRPYFPLQEWLDNERNVLREEISALRARGITVILLPVNPFFYQTSNLDKNPQLPFWAQYGYYSTEFHTLHTEYNARLREVAGEFDGVYYLDTIALFDSLDRSKLYIDYIHYSPEGNQIIADEIRKIVMGLFPVF